MIINPHNTCAKILDTLRSSGLTYTLNETPYSVYLTVRKKFTKEYTPSLSTQATNEQNNNVVDISKYEDVLGKLHDEISNHILTKRELSEREEELSQAVDANNWNIEDSRNQHFSQVETISQLTAKLAQEEDEHAQSEAALRKLEERLESQQIQLEKAFRDIKDYDEEKDSLRERLEDAEQETDNSRNVIKTLNEKLLHYEMKQAELATLDTYVLKAKVQELEGTITGKDNIISLLKNQASLSLNEIKKLRQISPQSASSDTITLPPQSEQLDQYVNSNTLHPQLHLSQSCPSPVTPILPSSSSKAGLNTSLSYQTDSHLEETKIIDHNRNKPPTSSSEKSPPQGNVNESLTNFTHDTTDSDSQHSSPGPSQSKNSEKFCQNCKKTNTR